jgi:hypothetical protein
MRISWVAAGAAVLVLAGCSGGDDDAAAPQTTAAAVTDTVALPPECENRADTIVFERTGSNPAGSQQLPLVTAVALPVPIVPDADRVRSTDQLRTEAAATDTLTYVIYVGDEEFPSTSVSLFSDGPSEEGKVRGSITLTPTSTPLKTGDVVQAGTPELDTFTTLSTLTADIKTAAGQFTAYRGDLQGEVRVLALTDDTLCIDADLTWPTSDGELRVDGVIRAVLAPRAITWFS